MTTARVLPIGRARPTIVRSRYRRIRDIPDDDPRFATLTGSKADQDRLMLEDKVATLIERVPEHLLGMMLHLMDDDDLVVLDTLARGVFGTFDYPDEGRMERTALGQAAIRRAAKNRRREKGGAL